MSTVRQTLARVTPMQWFVLFAVITCALAIGLPPDPSTLAKLHTNAGSYKLAILAILVPYVVIWFLSFFAWGKLRQYVALIKKSREAKAFRSLTVACGVLAFGVVIPTIISLILNDITAHHRGVRPVSTLTSTYLSMLVAVVVFTIMGEGARGLSLIAKVRPGLTGIRLFVISFIFVGSFFTYMMVHNNYTSHHPLYLGNVPLIITVVVPYLYAWFAGILASYELKLYSSSVKGLLYRKALGQFSSGLIVVIAASIGSQFVNAALSNNKNLSLGFVLVIDYIILVVIAIGLILLALGTKQLKKIEEV